MKKQEELFNRFMELKHKYAELVNNLQALATPLLYEEATFTPEDIQTYISEVELHSDRLFEAKKDYIDLCQETIFHMKGILTK